MKASITEKSVIMIEYSKTAADNKNRIKEMTWMKGRIFMIFAMCVLPLSVFLFLVGFFGNVAEAVQMGTYAATLDVVLVVMYAILYDKFTKAVTRNFDAYELDGKIDFTLEQIDDETMEFTRLTDEETFQISKKNIKKIRYGKTIILIILKDGRTIDVPKRADIEDIIKKAATM
jgi:hypothetical protein